MFVGHFGMQIGHERNSFLTIVILVYTRGKKQFLYFQFSEHVQ